MKALTGSASKTIVESFLERRVGSISVSDHQRHELCLKPLLRNDKAFNFRLLQLGLAQRKGFQPLRAIESKTQEDLEIVDPVTQDQQTTSPMTQDQQTTNELKFVNVKFQLQKQCMFGEQFFIAGDDPIFGLWDPESAIPMNWSDGHVWTTELVIPTGKSIQFKFILKKKGGDIEWQPGPDRIFQTWETMNRVTICEDWEDAELQKIIEEEESAQTNEKAQIDSEMSMVAENLGHPDEKQATDMAEDLSIEDSQTHMDEKPLAEPDLEQIIGDSLASKMEKPLAIVAENICSSEHLNEKTSQGNPMMNMIPLNEKSADSLTKEAIMHDFEHSGKAASIRTEEEERVADGKLFELEESPVLLPGLTQSIAPIEEAVSDEVEERSATDSPIEASEAEERITTDSSIGAFEAVERITTDSSIEAFEAVERITTDSSIEASEAEERIAMDSSIEASEAEERITMDSSIETFEAEDQNAPEIDKEQKSDDGLQLETNAALNNREELHDNDVKDNPYLASTEEISVSLAKVEMSDSESVDGNVLKRDIAWGRETLKKFLTIFGLA